MGITERLGKGAITSRSSREGPGCSSEGAWQPCRIADWCVCAPVATGANAFACCLMAQEPKITADAPTV
jgi:hypothetical protein